MFCAAAVLLLLLAVCVAVPASAQHIWPLDVTLRADRVGDQAVGNVIVINPTKEPVEVCRHVGLRSNTQHCAQIALSCKQHDASNA
jgi:hypothetical protein